MPKKLDDVIKAILSPDKDVTLKNTVLSLDNLDEIVSEATAKAVEISAKKPEEISNEDVELLTTYTAIVNTAREYKAEQAEAKKATDDRATKVAEMAKTIAEPPVVEAPKVDDKPEAKPDTKEVVATSPIEVTPAEPVIETPAVAEPSKELVGAGAGSGAVAFSVSNLTSAPPTKTLVGSALNRTFSVDGLGRESGAYTNMGEVADAVLTQLRLQPTMGGAQERFDRLAVYKRPLIEEFTALNQDSDVAKLDNLASFGPKWDRTAGQYAAGWCAPSENDYELCPSLTSLDGIVELPQMVAARGGIRTTNGPNFQDLYANASVGQVLTEAQVIAATVKTCIEINCPTTTETRLDVNPLCVTGNLLATSGYPEYTERFIREVIAANAHKINLNILTRMATASTAVTLPGATGPLDTSSLSWFLDAASLYATWLREQYRTPFNQVVEVVAPHWYLQQMVADVSRRNGVDLLVAEQRIREAFASRDIRVQWVYDWQPMPATALLARDRATTAQILVYLPGTFVKLVSPVINLGTMYSPAQLATNQYTALFVEEGFNVLERCFQSLLITVPTCPSGTTGAATGSCDSTP